MCLIHYVFTFYLCTFEKLYFLTFTRVKEYFSVSVFFLLPEFLFKMFYTSARTFTVQNVKTFATHGDQIGVFS